ARRVEDEDQFFRCDVLRADAVGRLQHEREIAAALVPMSERGVGDLQAAHPEAQREVTVGNRGLLFESDDGLMIAVAVNFDLVQFRSDLFERSEEHTSELQSL